MEWDIFAFFSQKPANTAVGMGIAIWLAKILIADALKDIKEIKKTLGEVKESAVGVLATLEAHDEKFQEIERERALIFEHERKIAFLEARMTPRPSSLH